MDGKVLRDRAFGFAELNDQLALQPGGDVLHLTHHPLALAVHIELGDLVAVVGDHERVGTGRTFGAGQLARAVRRVDGDLGRGALARVGGLCLLLGLAAGQCQTRQRSRSDGEGRMKLHVVDLSGSGRGCGDGSGFAGAFVGRRKIDNTMTR